jgi:hypothetical protein
MLLAEVREQGGCVQPCSMLVYGQLVELAVDFPSHVVPSLAEPGVPY